MPKQDFIPKKLQDWIEARKRYRLSDAQVQMARELGLNPKKLGSISNHDQEPWKLPLPLFIEDVYFKRFKKKVPDVVMSIERKVKEDKMKKQKKKELNVIDSDLNI